MTRHKHISAAALVVALLALVASLGGGSYAAGLITGADIKNKSITGKDIKKNAIKSKHIKNNSLKGEDLRDGSVGAADLAAGTLDDKFTTRRVAATSGGDFNTARTAAPEQVLFSEAPFTVYAKCFTDTSGPTTYAYVYIRTAVNGAVLAAQADDLGGGNASTDFLNTDTPEVDRELEERSASANSADYWRSQFSAFAPDQTGIAGLISLGAKNGGLAGGDGVYGAGDACIFALSNTSR